MPGLILRDGLPMTKPTINGFLVMLDSGLTSDEIEARVNKVKEIQGIVSVTPIVDILHLTKSIFGVSSEMSRKILGIGNILGGT